MLFEKTREYIKASGIEALISQASAVIVGYSGGADSGVLLSFLISERSKYPRLKIIAAHVNHMIRGEEADRDEAFCRDFCSRNNVEFECSVIDIPALSRSSGKGLEETARDERYAFFESLSKKYDGALIATAHNADDNLETVLFNLSRGSGTKGLSGISPIRNKKYIRPLLSCSSDEIRSFAKETKIEFVLDSTNSDTAYTRNAIRKNVLPVLRGINPRAAYASLRLSEAAREDCDFIENEAKRIVEAGVSRKQARELHPALFKRVLLLLYRNERGSVADLSGKNFSDCQKLLESAEGGSVSLPHGFAFFADKNDIYVKKDKKRTDPSVSEIAKKVPVLQNGTTEFGKFCITCTTDGDCNNIIDENVYNLSLHTALDCDKINGDIYARVRRSGDTVRIHKMTKKLKKLYCDADVPRHLRDTLPILEDEDGILFVPFVGSRDNTTPEKSTDKVLYLHIYERS